MKGKEEGFFLIVPDRDPQLYKLYLRAADRTLVRCIIKSRDGTFRLDTSNEEFPHLSDLVKYYGDQAAVGDDLPIALGANHHRIAVSSRGVSYRHADASSPTVSHPHPFPAHLHRNALVRWKASIVAGV